MALNKIIGLLFGWTLGFGNLGGLVIVSFILNLTTTLVYKYFTDQEALKNIREENKKLQDEMKNHKDNPGKLADLQKEALKKGFLEPMKHQMKPLLITFFPFVLIFGWLRTIYSQTGDIFLGMGWFGTYLLFSVLFSTILRKVLKVY